MLTPDQHAALVAELRDDPAGLGYAGKPPEAAYALLHEEREVTPPYSLVDRLKRQPKPVPVRHFARIGSAFIGLAGMPNRIDPVDFSLAYVEAFA